MSSILHTALKQNRDNEGVRYRSLKAKYLAKQGVVFEVNSSNRISHPGFDFDFNFGFGDGARFVIPDAPEPIDVHEIERQVEEAMEHVNEQDWGVIVSDALESSREAMARVRDRLRSLRDVERELSYERRELERERRELEFESRSANSNDERKEFEQLRKELDKRTEELEKRRTEINKYASEIELENIKKNDERIEAYKKSTKKFLAHFEGEVADAMCRYGAGLKALPDNENVSFVLSKFGDGTPGEKKDRIYVFSYKDIRSCVSEKIDADELLTRVESYVF